MAPMWGKAFILCLVAQITSGYDLPTVLSVTVEKVLQGVETRLASQAAELEARLATMETRSATRLETLLSEHVTRQGTLLSEQVTGLETRLTETFDKHLADQTTALGTRLAGHTLATGEALGILKANLEQSTKEQLEILEPLAEQTKVMSEQILALQTRQTQIEGAKQTHLTRVIEERYANITGTDEEARHSCSIRLDALQETIENVTSSMQGLEEHSEAIRSQLTEHTVALETRLAQQNVAITSYLTGAIDAKYGCLKANLDEATDDFYNRVNAFQEKVVNEIRLTLNYTEHRIQGNLGRINTTVYAVRHSVEGLTEQSVATETRLTEQTIALETGLAQQEGAIMSAIGEKYESLTETVGESIMNGTYHITTKMMLHLAEQSMAMRARLTQLEGAITTHLAVDERCENLTATLREATGGLYSRVDALQTTLSADSQDIRELVTETYNSLRAQVLAPGSQVVFLRRLDGSVNFTRPWADYKAGFGNRGAEFWLGLDTLHALTTQRQYKLQVELTAWSGERKWEVHTHFSVGGESEKYRLSVSGYDRSVSTTRSDYLYYYNGKQFTTIDNDNDGSSSINSAIQDKGGWWYGYYTYTNPTGVYRPAGYTGYNHGDGGIMWYGAYWDWRPFKELTLKLIPV